jgi:hypothetical protein
MRDHAKFFAPLLLVVALALFGCGKQETPPEPTPTPTPPPPTATNYCHDDGDNCEVKVKDIKDEQGKAGHTCDNFDEPSAIHYSLTTGKYKSIKVVKNNATDPDFEVAITPCGDAPADPFGVMPPKKKVKEWTSGKKNKKYKDSQLEGKRYTMMVTEAGAAQGADPHIVIDGTGKNK